MSSPVFARAVAEWRELRAEFDDYQAAAYTRAEADCKGAMLNARGRRAGIDPLSLFMGNRARAHAYASDELVEWWASNGRPTFEQFERGRSSW